MRLIFAVLLLVLAQPTWAVEISNFRSGLACTNSGSKTAKSGWICQPTEDVLVTDQGSCVYDGKTQSCTWVGFEFDYANAGADAKLQCLQESSAPTAFGNPEEVISQSVRSQDFEIPLKGDSGHFFNPQYFIFMTTQGGRSDLVVRGTCRSGSTVVFRYRFNVRFPSAS